MKKRFNYPISEKNGANKSSLIKNDIKRILMAPGMYIAYSISLFILLRPLAGAFTGKTEGTFLQYLSVPFAASDFTPFAAIFCVLPFGGSFCEDYNSGYIRWIVLRVGAKKYSFQRCMTVMLSGGIMMSVTVATVIFICAGLTTMPETQYSADFLRRSVWAQMGVLLKYHGIVLALLKILLAFLFGALWALAGLTVSAFVTNRYVTYIAPFVLYQILWILLEGSAFNPVYMLRGDSNFIPSFQFIILYQVTLIIMCCAISYWGIRKKVEGA